MSASYDTWRGGRRPEADAAEQAARLRRAEQPGVFTDGHIAPIRWPWHRLAPKRDQRGRFMGRNS